MAFEILFSDKVSDYIVELNQKYPNISNEDFADKVNEFIDRNRNEILLEEGFKASDFDFDEDEDVETDEVPENDEIPEDDDEDEVFTKSPKKSEIDVEDETAETDVTPEESDVDKTPEDDVTPEEGDVDKTPEDDEDEEVFVKPSKGTSVKKSEDEVFTKKKPSKPKPISFLDGDKKMKKITIVDKPEDEDDRFITVGGKRRRIVNNSKDKELNIHYVVDKWYDNCIKKQKKDPDKPAENEQRKTALSLLYTQTVSDMSTLFAFCNVPKIDLSEWDTSGVENMEGMFYRSTFNNDSIENWDVSNCKKFKNMFTGSKFAGDISKWVTATVEEPVLADDGTPEEYWDTDPDTGKKVLVTKTRKIHVPLPKVGVRLAEIENELDDRIIASLDELDYREDIKENRNMKDRHVLTIEEFVNEGLYDKIKQGIKKGVEYVKNKFNIFKVKLNNFFVLNFNPDTKTVVNAMDPLTTINYITTEKPSGVSVFTKIESPLLVSGVDSVAEINDTSERYGWMEEGSQEYRNYVEFMNIMSSNKTKNTVTEARTSLGAKGSGLDGIPNIDGARLEELINEVMFSVPAYDDDLNDDSAPAITIFGAPGIGKTSIPKNIIRNWNKNHPNAKKSIIIIQCGDLELGGFNIPMPRFSSLGETIYANPKVRQSLIEQGMTNEQLDNLKNTKFLRTFESPKTWLPVWCKNGTDDEIKAGQAQANGRTNLKKKEIGKSGKYEYVREESTEGGLIIFDEFLRADPELFKTIMQLVQERTIGNGEYVLGTAWGIVLCSNRPVDDKEVADRWQGQTPAMGNRSLGGIYNFIPDFYEWLEWAKTDGHFDESTIAYLSQEAGNNKEVYQNVASKEGVLKDVTVFKNWHTIDPDKFYSGQEPIPTTPRGWAALMKWVRTKMRIDGLDSIFDIENTALRNKAHAVIGTAIGDDYADFMEKQKRLYASGARPKPEKFFTGKVDKINTETYRVAEVTKDIETYVRNTYTREDVINDKSIGEAFLTMAETLDKFYGESMTTDIPTLHNNIVREIFKIKNYKEGMPREDKKMLINMKPYLQYVCSEDGYDINMLD